VWQIIAIVALLAATAGWTTVAVIALRGSDPAAVASPTETAEPDDLAAEESIPPVVDTHDAPELEALLPTAVNGTNLQLQSVTGGELLTDDEYSETVKAFLTSVGKTPEDLHFAQAYDPEETLDGSFEVYQVAGVDGAKVRDTLIEAWKVDFPDLKVTDATIAGQPTKKAEFDADTPASYLYVRGEHLFDIWTMDPEIAAAAIAALPGPGGSGAPASSVTPGASSSAAPSSSTGP
jgi:hypothetical protein